MSEQEPEHDLEEIDAVLPPGEQAEAVLRDVQAALSDVVELDVDVDDVQDLERVRQVLPTEPHRARLVQAALPPILGAAIEYVEPSERQSGYWRRSRERSDPAALSDAELKQRLAFIESRTDHREEFGTVYTEDGRRISRSVAQTAEELRGHSFQSADAGSESDSAHTTRITHTKGKGLLRRILDRLP